MIDKDYMKEHVGKLAADQDLNKFFCREIIYSELQAGARYGSYADVPVFQVNAY